ncbi:hypothetical protein EDB19DRAFT_1635612 [Suillus lakei]|nr:hypothetical protein EDB19DRAFT_1635612 [Suillus lakei]
MEKVTAHSLAYIVCQVCGSIWSHWWQTMISRQVRFAPSSVTSWRSFNGDFDYVQFWRTIVDFFERAPGRDAQRRVDRLLEWWTRYVTYSPNLPRLSSPVKKVFGRSRREDLTNAAKANMSVNALAMQRAVRDDAAFDSP